MTSDMAKGYNLQNTNPYAEVCVFNIAHENPIILILFI